MIEDLVERSADPARVRLALARLPHPAADLEAVAEPLVAVLAASRSLTQVLAADAGALSVLATGAPRTAPPPQLGDLVTWKRRELLRIAGRDLTGVDDLVTTTAALAELAADVLSVVAGAARATLGADDRLAVIGMGKLGGVELNYASDVDVVLAGDGDVERLERAAREVLEQAGHAFRVDADLRPEGRDGPLVRTVPSYEAYWQRWAEPWERQALLKARAVAGDLDLGAAWELSAARFLWGEPFGPDDLRYVRAMKVRAEASGRGDGERDVKHGPGGIRDIEFAVQLLQLVHGGVDPELRARGTLAALDELRRGGYVDPADAASLDESYRFLRRVEHVAQLEDERQVHSVPADRDSRRRLARVLGFRGAPEAGPTDAFDRALAAHRLRVRGAHERVWFRPLLESLSGAGPLDDTATAERLAAFGFADVERTRQAVAELTRGLTRSSRMMQQLLPLLLDWLSSSPDPDLGLLGLRRLASGEGRSRALAITFRDSPEVARHLALLLGTSRQLGEVLLANPDLIERLPHPDRLRTLERDDLVSSAHGVISWRGELDDQQRALQRWKQRHLLGVAARDVFGHAAVDQVGVDLTRLAEATLECALGALHPKVAIAVVAFGRLGGGEVGYASDLDVAFVHDGTDAAEAERVAAGVLRFVGGDTPAERIFAIDADLRPEGRSGPLSRSLDGWEAYLARWVSTWERQAYLRARAVAGDRALGAELVDRLEEAIAEQPLTPDDERDVRRMKVRIERERLKPGDDPEFHLKLGKGSLSDVEFTVQLLQLRHGLVEPSTMAALGSLVEDGHLPLEEAEVLEESYRFCEGTRNRTFLVVGSGDSLPTRPELLAPVARSLGQTVPELRERYRRVTRRARRVVERRFYGQG
ncbi:MAG: bifunctional [glutamine synthetase] adenylyltransferase/[glutamine synthetase]-adenylyl-L-tyrosine phosphorylase [Acidimicrobiales bacterium]